MKKIIFLFLLLNTHLCLFSQSYASLDTSVDFPSDWESTALIDVQIVESPTYFTFNSIDYNDKTSTLSLNGNKTVKTFSIYKDGEVYLHRMPIDSKILNVNYENFEDGNYLMHLHLEKESEPVKVELNKSKF